MKTSWLDSPSSWRTAWIVWAIFLTVIIVLVGLHPDQRTVTPEYRHAALHWWAGENIYHLGSIHGFLYLPVAALFYTPFTWLPLAAGEVLWRIISLGTFAWAVWRLCRLHLGEKHRSLFLLVSLLTIPAALSSARNGQTNMPLATLFICAAVELSAQRWNFAALWLCLALMLKPISLVLVLLVAALYPLMRGRLALGLVLLLVIPFAHHDPRYVWHQYELCAQKLLIASQPHENNFNDIGGMFATAGVEVGALSLAIVRGLAALLVLGLGWLALRRASSPQRASFFLTALGVTYLMAFNPRTETNSYVILAPFIAAVAMRKWHAEDHRALGLLLVLCALGLGSDSYGSPIFPWTNLWLKVLLALGFLIYLAQEILRWPARLNESLPIKPDHSAPVNSA